jgi:hypothetical protein
MECSTSIIENPPDDGVFGHYGPGLFETAASVHVSLPMTLQETPVDPSGAQ